jgi:ribosomal protein S18 acetylase RimI-like enzyme
VLILRPMTDSEYDAYLARLLPNYAQGHVEAGSLNPNDALRKAEAQVRELLPDGPRTPDQYLFCLEEDADGAAVGILWFARQDRGVGPHAFVYDIEIEPEFRRRGYASQAFRLLEERVRGLGLSSIALHVFGRNQAARSLYSKLGYVETHVMMAKSLD